MGLPKTSTKRDKIDILETLQSIAGAKCEKHNIKQGKRRANIQNKD